jgi:Flp pilus assembly pilin Flp
MDTLAHTSRRIATYIQSRVTGEAGASLVEYTLLITLIAIVALIAVQTFGDSLGDKFDDVGSSVAGAGS